MECLRSITLERWVVRGGAVLSSRFFTSWALTLARNAKMLRRRNRTHDTTTTSSPHWSVTSRIFAGARRGGGAARRGRRPPRPRAARADREASGARAGVSSALRETLARVPGFSDDDDTKWNNARRPFREALQTRFRVLSGGTKRKRAARRPIGRDDGDAPGRAAASRPRRDASSVAAAQSPSRTQPAASSAPPAKPTSDAAHAMRSRARRTRPRPARRGARFSGSALGFVRHLRRGRRPRGARTAHASPPPRPSRPPPPRSGRSRRGTCA